MDLPDFCRGQKGLVNSFLLLGTGHTFMPTDSDFCVIDTNFRKQGYLLFCVGHRKRVVRESTAKHPFTVVDMESSDLKKVKILLTTATKDDKNTDGKKPA